MKRLLTVLLILILALSLAACSGKPSAQESKPLVNPVNLTISILDGDDDITMDGFEGITDAAFMAEEGSTVLEATQLYCMSHDITITADDSKGYVSEIYGFTQGDYDEMTGWIFTVNGKMGLLGANEQVIEDGDSIAWEFVDFSVVDWNM